MVLEGHCRSVKGDRTLERLSNTSNRYETDCGGRDEKNMFE